MGRRNRPTEQVWAPENAARFRAGVGFGLTELAKSLVAEFGELDADASALIDNLVGWRDLPPLESGSIISASG